MVVILAMLIAVVNILLSIYFGQIVKYIFLLCQSVCNHDKKVIDITGLLQSFRSQLYFCLEKNLVWLMI